MNTPTQHKSTPLQRAEEYAKKFDRGSLDRFDSAVQLVHVEGTTFFWHSAYALQFTNEDGTWFAVFPEHHDMVVVEDSETLGISMFRRVWEIEDVSEDGFKFKDPGEGWEY